MLNALKNKDMPENDIKMPDLSGIFDMISKNPDIIKNAVNAFSGMTQTTPSSEVQKPREEVNVASPSVPNLDPSMLTSLLPMLTNGQKSHKDGKPNHHDLLCALRPYLSHERRAVIDKMLEFGQLGDILKSFESKK
jgi:hypothetical protein